MLKAFITVIAIITNDGHLQTDLYRTESCKSEEYYDGAARAAVAQGLAKEVYIACFPAVEGRDA